MVEKTKKSKSKSKRKSKKSKKSIKQRQRQIQKIENVIHNKVIINQPKKKKKEQKIIYGRNKPNRNYYGELNRDLNRTYNTYKTNERLTNSILHSANNIANDRLNNGEYKQYEILKNDIKEILLDRGQNNRTTLEGDSINKAKVKTRKDKDLIAKSRKKMSEEELQRKREESMGLNEALKIRLNQRRDNLQQFYPLKRLSMNVDTGNNSQFVNKQERVEDREERRNIPPPPLQRTTERPNISVKRRGRPKKIKEPTRIINERTKLTFDDIPTDLTDNTDNREFLRRHSDIRDFFNTRSNTDLLRRREESEEEVEGIEERLFKPKTPNYPFMNYGERRQDLEVETDINVEDIEGEED
jgi:hypothetical protein